MPPARPDPEALFASIAARRHVALAVSGGSDSMALLRLAADWRGHHDGAPVISVLTVDHGLRPAAALEAGRVGQWAAEFGLPHVTLRWLGPSPSSGLQAKARTARYDLMSGWCEAHGADVLLTAHTLEDQAETVLMRLARTSSLDSLVGIARLGHWRATALFRPLLSSRREVLRDYLRGLGQAWIDDPSNDDDRFERVRIRKIMPMLAELGIGAEALSELAARAAEAVEGLRCASEDWVKLHAAPFDTGYCAVPLKPFRDQTATMRSRILGALIGYYGAGRMPEPGELDQAAQWIATGSHRRTLGGAIMARRHDGFLVGREPGRIANETVMVDATGTVLWDGRFAVAAPPGSSVLAAGKLPGLARHDELPGFVQESLPAIRLPGGELVVPHLGIGSGAQARFAPPPRR